MRTSLISLTSVVVFFCLVCWPQVKHGSLYYLDPCRKIYMLINLAVRWWPDLITILAVMPCANISLDRTLGMNIKKMSTRFQLWVYTNFVKWHYYDVIMGAAAPRITSLTIVYSTVFSDADQRKHQSSALLAFVRGIHRGRWIPRKNGQ